MTITPSIELSVCKEAEQDVQIDRRKYEAPARDGAIVVLANHKGGVTKTTSTANLGAMIAEAERQVLMVDCDPQANLSEAFGWGEERSGERLEDLLARPEVALGFMPPIALGGSITPSPAWRERLRIIACTDALADVAADLPHTVGPGYEMRLRDVLAPLRSRFDVILLDTPPGLGNLSGMAMLAADRLLIPALAADLDVRGAGKLYDLVENEIPGLKILGVLIAASERRWRITRDATTRMVADDMRVLPVQVPRAVRVASAPRYGAPTAVLEPDSLVSHAYRQLAHHLLRELGR
ncbi:MAG: ParA family protein [Gaiellaceae bacterium]